MIVVIADDLTGAAELGGLGLQYGLKVEIATYVDLNSKAQLLVNSTDTRSIRRPQAIEVMASVTEQILNLKPQFIFKKVDSVLRGYVVDELKAHLKILGLKKALLVPANPALGRTIVDGVYFIHGQPVHTTSFSSDPEFPVVDSNVLSMLGQYDSFVQVKKLNEKISEEGIFVGEVGTTNDVDEWASRVDDKVLPAGGSGFFRAMLESRGMNKQSKNESLPVLGYPKLFVSGTTFSKNRGAVKDLKAKGGPVSYMPAFIIDSGNPTAELYHAWCHEIISLLKLESNAIIAVDENTTEGVKISAERLREITATVVSHILNQISVSEVIIEGGSTASAIIRKQGFNKFYPVNEYVTGVVRMLVDGQEDLHLTIKPGSYSWPGEIWNF